MQRTVIALLLAVSSLLLVPATASAHARLLTSTPAGEAVVTTTPGSIELEFSAGVTAGADSIQVFAPDEQRVDVGEPSPTKGTRIVQRIDTDQQGTFGVAYSVSSEDGHVIKDAFTFSVGAPSGGDDGAAATASRNAAAVDRTLQVAFSVVRFIEVLALLVAAGGGIFACLIAPEWRPRLLLPALITLLLAYAAGLVIDSAILRGNGIGDALSIDAMRAAADTPFGLSLQVRAIVAVVAIAPALLLRQGRTLAPVARWALAVVFVGLGASMSITGHAVTTNPTVIRMPLDMVHVAAAAIWIGGLVQLAHLAPYASAHVESVVRFSRTAFASVVVLLLTGLYATYAELGLHPNELVDSTYGRLIVAKLLLYLGTMPLAGNNMQTFVPQVRRRPEDAPRMLRQYVWREFALLVVVLALTVWLIATPQPH